MSILGDCTSVKDLWIEQNLRNAAHGQTLAPVAIMPGAIVPAGRRVVHVTHMDGTTETDLEWLARQAELDDYYQTVHDASYRGQ